MSQRERGLCKENARLRMKLDDAEAHVAQLERALVSRIVIGQAQGILMARTGLSADQAIAHLKRASMNLNGKLIDIARGIVDA